MAKNLLLKSELSRWFNSQNRFGNRKEMAAAIGIPYDTLKGTFKGKCPRPENARRLSEITGLDPSVFRRAVGPRRSGKAKAKRNLKDIAYAKRALDELQADLTRCLAALIPARKVLTRQAGDNRVGRTHSAQSVQLLMDALQRNLEPFLGDPEALSVLRQAVSGSDAGYLSGLLGAIFDDRRLERWREMTTYQYGSK
jgi:hypothetical protein